jgi:hypothetical protein
VSPDSDPGIDQQNVLASITGTRTPTPSSSALARPADRPPSARRPAVAPPAPRWIQHRSELAAIVSAFVGILWLSVGIARGAWAPAILGMLFGIGALAIWSIDVWGAD